MGVSCWVRNCWGIMPLLSPRMGHPNDANVKCHKRLDLFSLDTNMFIDEMAKA